MGDLFRMVLTLKLKHMSFPFSVILVLRSSFSMTVAGLREQRLDRGAKAMMEHTTNRCLGSIFRASPCSGAELPVPSIEGLVVRRYEKSWMKDRDAINRRSDLVEVAQPIQESLENRTGSSCAYQCRRWVELCFFYEPIRSISQQDFGFRVVAPLLFKYSKKAYQKAIKRWQYVGVLCDRFALGLAIVDMG